MPPAVAAKHSLNVVRVRNASHPTSTDVIYTYDFDGEWEVSDDFLERYSASTRHKYIYILMRIWEAAERSGMAIVDDAIQILTEYPQPHTDRGCVVLSYHVSIHLLGQDSDAFRLAMGIQQAGIDSAASELDPHTNRLIYEHLARHDPERSFIHQARASHWRKEEERLEDERFLLRAADGRYFEIFWYYFTRVSSLPCDLPPEAIFAPDAHGNGAISEPLIFDQGGRPAYVSGSFLRLGHHLLHLHPDVDHEDRVDRVDELAHRHIDPLYTLLEERTDVSSELRLLIKRQHTRFEQL